MVTESALFRDSEYHIPTDTTGKMDFEFMAELVGSLVIFFLSHR